MRNLINQTTAEQIVDKAQRTFGNFYGTPLAESIGIPQPYVSKLKKFIKTGDREDLPPHDSIEKMLNFLNANNKSAPTPTGGDDDGEFGDGSSYKTDRELLHDIQLRFRMAGKSLEAIFGGDLSGVILSGPAGCGKSFNVEKYINEEVSRNPDTKFMHLKGASMSYTGLYELLYDHRDGGVIVFDDSDSLWDDENMMNLMKAAMDTSKTRSLSTASGGKWVAALAEKHGVETDEIRQFQFKGKIVFITNKDINGLIESKKRGWEHFNALVDRSFYIDLEMFSLRAKLLWCEHIFMDFIAPEMELSDDLTLEIMEFVSENRHKLRDISIRGIETIARTASESAFNDDWREFISVTRFKRNQ